MLKIAVQKVIETLTERSVKISNKIFQNDEDNDFHYFMKYKYEDELPVNSRERYYFKRDKERDIATLSIFWGCGIRVNELSNLRLRD
jgi:integrase